MNIRNNIIQAITSSYGLPYEVIDVEGETVSVALREKLRFKFQSFYTANHFYQEPILITAPTGSGKSTFVLQDLSNSIQKRGQGRILLLTNRTALRLQQTIISNKIHGFPSLGSHMLEKNALSGNVDIILYHEALAYLANDPYGTISSIGAVVLDEAHFFCSDSTFVSETSTILRALINGFSSVLRVYMTATPEDVKPIIAYEERLASDFISQMHYSEALNQYYQNLSQTSQDDKVLPVPPDKSSFFSIPPIKEYRLPSSFDYVKLHFFYSWDSIVDSAATEGEKWLIFVRTKDDGKILKDKFKGKADFMYADIRSEDKSKFINLVRKERFESDVLISTTVLYNGVNFKDDKLKHIVIDSYNQTEMKQMLGRKRLTKPGEVINLYVRIPEVSELETYKRKVDYQYDITEEYLRDPLGFFRSKWNSKKIDDTILSLFGVSHDLRGEPLLMSDYAPYQLARESGDYEGFIDNMTENEQFFQEEVCQWFGKVYSPEMLFGAQKEEMKEKVIQKICECVETYKRNLPFDVLKCEELWKNLKEIIWPNKRLFYDNGNKSISTKYNPINEENKYNRLVGDINRMLKFCKLPYEVSKVNGKHGAPSEWTYRIDETNIIDGEQVDASAESEQE